MEQTSQETKQEEKRPVDGMVRRVCFTYNNYTAEGEAQLLSLVKEGHFTYFIGGYEQCPTTGTPHIQGYCKLKTRKRFSTLKSMFPQGVHFEYARGTTNDNIKYIKNNPQKPPFKVFFEEGNEKSSDSEYAAYEVKEWLEQGLTLDDLLSDPSYTVNSQTIKLFDRLSSLYAPKRGEKPEVIWVYGEPGSGKTHWVTEREGDNLYSIQLDKKWFDGYNKHEALLWDDFDLDMVEMDHNTTAREKLEQQRLLQRLFALCDRYEYRANVKGSSVQILAKRIYIVAHQPPWELWRPNVDTRYTVNNGYLYPSDEQIQSNSILAQIMRRITAIKHIKLSKSRKLEYPKVEVIINSQEELDGDVIDVTPVVPEKKAFRLFKKI